MIKLNVMIIDDEPLARKGLKEYIADVDFLQLSGEFDSPLKAMELISRGEVQLLFLDIQMPKITGLDFFKSLQQAPPVIFTTAYPQYALDGFELNALDYLVKPISFDRFLKAALKAKEYYELRQQNKLSSSETVIQKDFFIKSDNQLVRIAFDELLFIEALQNYVCIHTAAKKYISYLTMRSVEEYLPEGQFIKTHKSFIVNAAKIDAIEGNEICIGTYRIPISRNEKEEVMELLLKNKFLKR
jgi:DNA-binding LytR/AlgR family response regulator